MSEKIEEETRKKLQECDFINLPNFIEKEEVQKNLSAFLTFLIFVVENHHKKLINPKEALGYFHSIFVTLLHPSLQKNKDAQKSVQNSLKSLQIYLSRHKDINYFRVFLSDIINFFKGMFLNFLH